MHISALSGSGAGILLLIFMIDHHSFMGYYPHGFVGISPLLNRTEYNSKSLDISPESEPAQEQQSRTVSRVEAHHRVNGPDTGRNSGGWTNKF